MGHKNEQAQSGGSELIPIDYKVVSSIAEVLNRWFHRMASAAALLDRIDLRDKG